MKKVLTRAICWIKVNKLYCCIHILNYIAYSFISAAIESMGDSSLFEVVVPISVNIVFWSNMITLWCAIHKGQNGKTPANENTNGAEANQT